ncbi:MAG: hypothetical protein KF833_11780 [Verrucomicrobiae bacterium]|nr:hypothetical protein [Verrucomicrobiae bacterium]
MNTPAGFPTPPAERPRVTPWLSGILAVALHAHAIGASPEPAPQEGAPDAPQPGPPPTATEPVDLPDEDLPDTELPELDPVPGDFRNWLDVSVGGLMVHGDAAAAQGRLGLPATAFGGIESFRFEQDVGKRGLFRIDAHSLFAYEDYRVRLEYTDLDWGYVRVGTSRRLEFDDPSGGWFPANAQWIDLYDDPLELARGSAEFEAGLRREGLPDITLRYRHLYRDGLRSSTHWGDTGLTGGFGVRAIVPSLRRIDETTDIVSLDVRQALGNTTVGAGFTYETSDLDSALLLRRRPGESSDRHITQTERIERDLYGARAFVDTLFHDRLRLSSAYLFTTLDTTFGGSRIAGAGHDPIYDPIFGRRDVGFLDLTGGAQLDQHVWNLNLLWTPFPHLAVIPSVRIEHQTLDGSSSWLDTGTVPMDRQAANARDTLDLSQHLEIRYTGITNVVLYSRADWTQGDGNLLEIQRLPAYDEIELRRDTDFDRFSQKYTAGLLWYPLTRLNLHAQYYRKARDNRYGETSALHINPFGLYPAFIREQDFVTDDVNLRVTFRPLRNLTLISRYDYQHNTFEHRGTGLDFHTAAASTAHIFSETITWTPFPRFYLQPSAHYALDRTRSAATAASVLAPADNDYLSLNATAGFVLDHRTDLQAQYRYYLADNFEAWLLDSQPYNSGLEEHGVLATITRRIHPRLRVNLRYGYFQARSTQSGGNNDYHAHLLYSSAHYLF